MTTNIVAEYIWLDSNNNFRSKSRTLRIRNATEVEVDNLPIWNYDGSSTGQATTENSEVDLHPRAVFNCPFRGQNSLLVVCDTYNPEGEPLSNNHRARAKQLFDENLDSQPWFGLEQEYFIMNPNTNKPLGFPNNGYPEPQGQYYCSVGTLNNFGRKVADLHYKLCLAAGVKVSGMNAEVAPGQWEFQVGPCEGIEAGDHMMVARYILERVAELSNLVIDLSPKLLKGEWNGSGCHVNYSTRNMRRGLGDKRGIDFINEAIERLSEKHAEHMQVYGEGNENRMLGSHETSSYDKFTSGVADRSASVRIPRKTMEDECGYLEDRRPASNIDPYLVTSKIFETTVLTGNDE
jgi:glutamine synthetase